MQFDRLKRRAARRGGSVGAGGTRAADLEDVAHRRALAQPHGQSEEQRRIPRIMKELIALRRKSASSATPRLPARCERRILPPRNPA